ncbi:hypothetical protein BC835DRAFT_667925 [Cytidiella melzeri]|nr:hypothetical protein BC835DRAFT_667925 [Cytidiella melzeri]
MATFLNLPDELIVYIATYIDITDVWTLRKVCRRCSLLSHERAIWEGILQSQSKRYPLPCGTSSTAPSPVGQTKDPEELATSVHVTAKSWLRHQQPALRLRAEVDSFQGMHVILDRWVVAILDTCFEVWDLYPSDEHADYIGLPRTGAWARGHLKPVCRLRDGIHGLYTSSAACVDLNGDAIILVVTCWTHDWSEKETTVQKIRLTSKVAESQLLGSIFDGPTSGSCKYRFLAVDPSSQLVAYSDLGNLRFWHWPTNSSWSAQREQADLVHSMATSLLCIS